MAKGEGKGGSGCRILLCGCDGGANGKAGAKFQDQKYGFGLRVHNVGGASKVVCTVCGKTHSSAAKVAPIKMDEK